MNALVKKYGESAVFRWRAGEIWSGMPKELFSRCGRKLVLTIDHGESKYYDIYLGTQKVIGYAWCNSKTVTSVVWY